MVSVVVYNNVLSSRVKKIFENYDTFLNHSNVIYDILNSNKLTNNYLVDLINYTNYLGIIEV